MCNRIPLFIQFPCTVHSCMYYMDFSQPSIFNIRFRLICRTYSVQNYTKLFLYPFKRILSNKTKHGEKTTKYWKNVAVFNYNWFILFIIDLLSWKITTFKKKKKSQLRIISTQQTYPPTNNAIITTNTKKTLTSDLTIVHNKHILFHYIYSILYVEKY